MKLRCLAIALTLVAAIASDSWGEAKQPSPSGTKAYGEAQPQSKPAKQEATPDQRGTDQFPLSVKIIRAEPKTEDTTANGPKENEKQATDWWMFGATVALAVIAVLQLIAFIAQASYMRRSYVEMRRTTHTTIRATRAAQKSAGAAAAQAKIAEMALTGLERPYLFILDYNWLLAETARAEGHKCGLVYSVANGGKLPAFIKAVKVGIRFDESIPSMLDEPPVHDLLTAPLIGGGEQRRVIQGFTDESDEPALQCQIRGGMAFIPGSVLRAGRMIAKISIEYDGPITTGHATTACWEWHPVKYAFTQFGGPEHNQRT